jgi:hypothetical protein
MSLKFVLKITIVLAISFSMYWFLSQEKEIKYPPGVLVNENPYQKDIMNGKPWEKGDYKITPLANFHLNARVLSEDWYHMDRESDLAPVDLALGWGEMSDQVNLDKIDISQGSRWYHWSTSSFPIPRRIIETESANMHIIPADEKILDMLNKVIKGNIIELNGYLVFIEAKDGWRWKSSLTRDDTGGGACEIIWVNDFKIIN